MLEDKNRGRETKEKTTPFGDTLASSSRNDAYQRQAFEQEVSRLKQCLQNQESTDPETVRVQGIAKDVYKEMCKNNRKDFLLDMLIGGDWVAIKDHQRCTPEYVELAKQFYTKCLNKIQSSEQASRLADTSHRHTEEQPHLQFPSTSEELKRLLCDQHLQDHKSTDLEIQRTLEIAEAVCREMIRETGSTYEKSLLADIRIGGEWDAIKHTERQKPKYLELEKQYFTRCQTKAGVNRNFDVEASPIDLRREN